MPLDVKSKHSITLLLPDGQRILYECFTEEDCTRGFRTPSLIEAPSPFAIQMLHRISQAMRDARASLPHAQADLPPSLPTTQAHTTAPKRDEALVVLDHGNQASVTGLLSALPNGQYTYNLEPLDRRQAPRLHILLLKTSPACVFPVPSAGLYDVSIWDSQNIPRINLFLAAIQPSQTSAFATYAKAKKLLAAWDADYYGWPIHDLQRAYLQALMHDGGAAATPATSVTTNTTPHPRP